MSYIVGHDVRPYSQGASTACSSDHVSLLEEFTLQNYLLVRVLDHEIVRDYQSSNTLVQH